MEAKLNGDTLEISFSEDLVASNLDKQVKTAKDFLSKHKKEIGKVVINMENVNEIDSLGINLIVGLYKQSSKSNKEFSVINTSKPIVNLFKLFKLSSYFDVS